MGRIFLCLFCTPKLVSIEDAYNDDARTRPGQQNRAGEEGRAAEVINGGVLTYLDESCDEADHHIPNCKAQV